MKWNENENEVFFDVIAIVAVTVVVAIAVSAVVFDVVERPQRRGRLTWPIPVLVVTRSLRCCLATTFVDGEPQ